MLNFIIYLLLFFSCSKKPPSVPVIQHPTTKQIKPLLPIIKPQLIGKTTEFQSSKFRLTILKHNPKKLSLREIEIKGVSTLSTHATVAPLQIKSTLDKWFDGNTKNYFEYTGNFPLIIELMLQNGAPFTIHEILFYPYFYKGEENTPSDFQLEVLINNQWEVIYTAQNVISDFIDLWIPHLPTSFIIKHPTCNANEEVDHLGVCHEKKITCFEIQDKFNEEIYPCSIKIENEEILCLPVKNKNECRMFLYQNQNISYCDIYKNFLVTPQSRLEIYFKNKQIFEQFCSTPIQ